MIRVAVDDEHGTAVQYADTAAIPPRRRSQLAALADSVTASTARLLGCTEEHARLAVMADLVRMAADEDAYQRVAERRGWLPL